MSNRTVNRDASLMRVLDNGYVRLDEVMGSDLKVVNAARASFDRHAETMRPKDERLLAFLAEHEHTTPFRHNMITFEVCAPVMVMRQLQRYVIGGVHSDTLGAWSEMSMRYVTRDLSFYIPRFDQWRAATEDKKQGSRGLVSVEVGEEATKRLMIAVDSALDNYTWAINSGICGEQARLFLPAFGLYSKWYMTLSLQAFAHLLYERLRPDAMFETRQYARVMYSLVEGKFPKSLPILLSSMVDGNPLELEDIDVP